MFEESLPWWKSRIIVGALISALLKLAVVSGLAGELSGEQEAALVDGAVLVLSFGGDLLAIISRVRQKAAPPITATKQP